MRNQSNDLNQCGFNPRPHPADFPLGSAESRAAARALLAHQPSFILDFGTLPILLHGYEEILRNWKDEGDRYTEETMRGRTLCRRSVLKDSDALRRLKEESAE